MEADSKNKRGRGRPRKFGDEFYKISPYDIRRTVQNEIYVGVALCHLRDIVSTDVLGFFITEKGNIRRKTILERVGRGIDAGLITDDEGVGLLEAARDGYNNGIPVKELARRIKAVIDSMKGYPL